MLSARWLVEELQRACGIDEHNAPRDWRAFFDRYVVRRQQAGRPAPQQPAPPVDQTQRAVLNAVRVAVGANADATQLTNAITGLYQWLSLPAHAPPVGRVIDVSLVQQGNLRDIVVAFARIVWPQNPPLIGV